MFRFTAKALACAAILSCAGLVQAAEEPIIIKFAHVVADNTPKGQVRCCSRNWPRSVCLGG